jgi:hypothetical protein
MADNELARVKAQVKALRQQHPQQDQDIPRRKRCDAG